MSDFLLTEQERQRFARWLELNADSSRGMLEQWQKLGGDQPHVQAISKKLRTEEMAYRIVAEILRSTEEMSLKSPNGE